MAYQATTGLGVAAKIVSPGNVSEKTTPGYNEIVLSLSGVNGPTTFQLTPELQDAFGNEITPGTAYVLTAVAASSPGALTLTGVAASVDGTAVYSGTITGGGSNAYEGLAFVIAGFTDTVNNGLFICTASTTGALTLDNANAVAETEGATATPQQGTAVYSGTFTGATTGSLVGQTFVVAGFTNAVNNGTFICTANSGTSTATLENAAAVAETHAATATSQEEGSNELTYVSYGFKTLTGNTYQPSGTATAIATVSADGLVTAVAKGEAQVETSYPTFNNAVGDVVSSGNIMNGLPINKIYAENRVVVLI